MTPDYQKMIQARISTLRQEIAASLAKNEPIDEATTALWQELQHLEAAYPEIAATNAAKLPTTFRLAYTSPETDREVLVTLYHATDGPYWQNNKNWLSDVPVGEWYGVTTDANGRIIYLNSHGNQLRGEIPRELGNLADLKGLALFGNRLSGEIPRELGNLTNLEALALFANRLSGEIPRELGNLANLKFLMLFANRLSGEIPRELGNLANLGVLALNDNQLSGEIPRELGDLTNLERLCIERNLFRGCVPSPLRCRLKFDGDLPSNLGDLPFCPE